MESSALAEVYPHSAAEVPRVQDGAPDVWMKHLAPALNRFQLQGPVVCRPGGSIRLVGRDHGLAVVGAGITAGVFDVTGWNRLGFLCRLPVSLSANDIPGECFRGPGDLWARIYGTIAQGIDILTSS